MKALILQICDPVLTLMLGQDVLSTDTGLVGLHGTFPGHLHPWSLGRSICLKKKIKICPEESFILYIIRCNVIWRLYELYGIKKHAHLCRLRDVLHSTLTNASFLFRLILETSGRTVDGTSLTKAKRGEPCKPIPRIAIQTVRHTFLWVDVCKFVQIRLKFDTMINFCLLLVLSWVSTVSRSRFMLNSSPKLQNFGFQHSSLFFHPLLPSIKLWGIVQIFLVSLKDLILLKGATQRGEMSHIFHCWPFRTYRLIRSCHRIRLLKPVKIVHDLHSLNSGFDPKDPWK